VQVAHACIEAAKAFLDNTLDHPHLVVVGINDESRLFKCAFKLENAGIRFKMFFEPDRNDGEYTALATEPVFGETRNIFRNYTLLGSGEGKGVQNGMG
jgi:hypothetical protein